MNVLTHSKLARALVVAALLCGAPALADDVRKESDGQDLEPSSTAIVEQNLERAESATHEAAADAARRIQSNTRFDLDIRLIGRKSIPVAAAH